MQPKKLLISTTIILLLLLSQTSSLTPMFVKAGTLVFEDGFESGNFVNWDNVTDVNIQSSIVHHGNYAVVSAGTWDRAIKYLARGSPRYARTYVYFATLPPVGQKISVIEFYDSVSGNDFAVGIKNDNGMIKWGRTYPNENYAATPNPVAGVWYCLEIKLETSVEERIFVDGTSVWTTPIYEVQADRLLVGGWDKGQSIADYVDCIKVSDSYIGTENPVPTYDHISFSATEAGDPCTFSCEWRDDIGLSGYIFSTNNTGSWVNETWVSLSGNPSWANVTKTLTSMLDQVVGFRWYCNNTNGKTGDTGIQALTTTGDWQYTEKLYFNDTAIAENLVDFPVFINLSRAGADFWSHVSSAGNDLRFVDSDCTTDLYFEVEYWNYTANEGYAWVKVPRIDVSSTSDFIYLYYGNPHPPPTPYRNSAGVWDSSFMIVQHLNQTSGAYFDSTHKHNDGTTQGQLEWNATGKIDGAGGFDGNDSYVDCGNDPSLTLTAYTIEAWIRRLGSGDTANASLGGFAAEPILAKGRGLNGTLGMNMNYFLGVRQTDGRVGFDFEDIQGPGNNHPIFSNTVLNDNEWYYLAVSYDGTERIYVNGFLDNSTQVSKTPGYNPWALTIGSSLADAGIDGFFNGTIDEARISRGARSSGWIEAQFLSMNDTYVTFGSEQAPNDAPNSPVNPSPTDGTAGVSLSPTLSVDVSDPDTDSINVSFYEANTRAPDNFTIVALPDTQYYSSDYPDIFDNQTRWIVNNAKNMNIVFATHEGDVVNTDTNPSDWDSANHSMSILDQGNLSWGIAPGNHDGFGPSSDYNATQFNTYFGFSRFNGKNWYGGAYQGTNNTNSYQLFTGGKDDYLIFHFQYDPSDDVLAWANATTAKYPTRRVIVTTHFYLNTDGTRSTMGNRIWRDFILWHVDQVFLVLSGHAFDGGDEANRTDVVDGHKIYQLLADYQERTNGGNGLLRILEFRPAEDKIYVKTYSPYWDQYETDTNSQFTLDYDMSSVQAIPPKLIGSVNNVPSGSSASVLWSGLNYTSTYAWYAVAEDSRGGTRQSDTWSFTTGANNPPNKPFNPNPTNETSGISISPTLSVNVTDPDGDPMNVSFYQAQPPSLIGEIINVPSGGVASIQWNGLDYSITYSWYAVANDTQGLTNQSDTWSFTTRTDNRPNKPFNPNPANGTLGVPTSPTLSVNVTDPEGDPINVSFYQAQPISLIGEVINVSSGGVASMPWDDLNYSTTYSWYAVAEDSQGRTNQSDTWSFATLANFSLTLNAGWNMVSFPVIPSNTTFASIFSEAGYYQVVTWSGTSYVDAENAEAGRGYWVLVLSATTLNITGTRVESYELDLPAGWSMIGSIDKYSVNATLVFPGYYQVVTWDKTRYVDSDRIETGKGYWALVLTPTHVVVDESRRVTD